MLRFSQTFLVAILVLYANLFNVNGQTIITHATAGGYTAEATLEVTNTIEYSGQMLSLLWTPTLPNGWTLVSASGDGNPESNFGEILWPGSIPASPIHMTYIVQVPAGQTGAKDIRGDVEYQLSGTVNPVIASAAPNPLSVSPSGGGAGGPIITHGTAGGYTAGNTLEVTNAIEYSGQMLSLLWTPTLPSGWTLVSASGDGNPEANFGEILWPGSIPASPIHMTYIVQVPAGQTGTKEIRGDVEYQLSGTVNPVIGPATPNPLSISEAGGGTGPSITGQPEGHDVNAGDSVTFSVTATGDGTLTYQWRQNGSDIAGATSSIYTIPSAQAEHEGVYSVLVSSGSGSVSSVSVVLLVQTLEGGPLMTHSAVGEYTAGGTLEITNRIEYTGQMLSLLCLPSLPIGWTLVSASGDGNPEANFGEILWPGTIPASPITLSYIVQAPAGESGAKEISSSLEYQLSGMINPEFRSASPDPLVVSDSGVATFPFITVQPQNVEVTAGSSVTLSVTATGAAPLAYQWKKNGVEIPGETGASYSVASAQISHEAIYTVVVSNSLGSVTSNIAVLYIHTDDGAPLITHAIEGGYTAGGTVEISATIQYEGQLLSLLWIPELPSGWTLVSASGDGNPEANFGEILWPGSIPASPLHMTYVVQVPGGETGTREISDTVEYQLSGTVNPEVGAASPDPLLIGEAGSVIAPVITTQPQAQTVAEGAGASFTVSVSGTVPMSYQWRKGGVNIAGAISPTYTIASAQTGDAGGYSVVVSNSGGSVASEAASLTVEPGSGTVVTFQMGSVSGGTDSEVVVPVTVRNFSDILSVQFSMHWDSGIAQYVGVEQFGLTGLAGGSFGVTQVASGIATLSWDNPNSVGETVADDSVLFAIRFKILGDNGASSALSIDGTPTPLEAANSEFVKLPVSASAGQLGVSSSVEISGVVSYYSGGLTVPGATMDLVDGVGTTVASTATAADGTYTVTVSATGSYKVVPGKGAENPVTQGMTTLDIALIRRHILAITPLNSPYKLLAADVNNSASVTTLDIALMRRMILAITTSVPAGNWRFVPSNYVFPDPENPWDAPGELQVDVSSGNQAEQSFVAIRFGDVNNSWIVP